MNIKLILIKLHASVFSFPSNSLGNTAPISKYQAHFNR